MKAVGHHLAVFKPSPVHWARLTEEVAKQLVFMDFIQLGASQALWQFVNTISVIPNEKSTTEAKETAVVTLIFINVTRMVLAQMMDPKKSSILSVEFLGKLSKVQTDKEMEEFVKTEFIPLVKFPTQIPGVKSDWISLARSHEPMEQIHKFLLKKVIIVKN